MRSSPLPTDWQLVDEGALTAPSGSEMLVKPAMKASPALSRSANGRGSGGLFKKMKNKVVEQDRTGLGMVSGHIATIQQCHRL